MWSCHDNKYNYRGEEEMQKTIDTTLRRRDVPTTTATTTTTTTGRKMTENCKRHYKLRISDA